MNQNANQKKFYKARFLIVWDGKQHRTLENGFMGVSGDTIEGIYTSLPEGTDYEDLGEKILCPGFINLHCHPSEVYFLKSYWEDLGNPNFYNSCLYDLCLVIRMGKESAEIQTRVNLAEIVKSGCTTSLIFGGPYSRMEADIAGQMGLRAYVGAGIRAGDAMEEQSIWNSSDGHSLRYLFDEKSGMKRIEEAARFAEDYNGMYDGRIRVLLAPTQTMTCTPKMLRATRKLADELKLGITIHGSESLNEWEACMRINGMTPVELLEDTGLLTPDVIVAHCIYIRGHSKVPRSGDHDFQLLSKSGASIAHSPTVFSRDGSILESLGRYLRAGINVGLGTDSYPSDMVQEMRCAAAMGKIADRSTFGMTARNAFNAATINGAKALKREDLGRLALGAKADFVVFDLNNIEMSPMRDVVKNIVYSATRHSIERVYIGGECVVRDRKIEGFDETESCRQLQTLMEKGWSNTAAYDREGRKIDQLSPLTCPRYTKKICVKHER